jgi:hypothetical protein
MKTLFNLVLAAMVVSLPCTHASFTTTNATTTVDVPPEGNPIYHEGDWLEQQSDHTITVKKVDELPPGSFYWRARNHNTCNDADASKPYGAYGDGWNVGHEETFTHYDLKKGGVLWRRGGFAVNSYTESKQIKEPYQVFVIEANDSNAFQVTGS